uniref:NADH dehydrogenase [ubiquinone] 1 beta subcomplex subunit 5, mitochondrial n=1 Tax=Syphacia muris TaxID=451379 RepID=A0A0N5AJ02_9BILA
FLVAQLRNSEHAAIFRRRPGQLVVNRIKDVTHFYFIGLGALPILLAVAYNSIKYGPCELKDYPTEGPPPRYWQFERTPIRQWWSKHFGISDIEHHERTMAYRVRSEILGRWRQIEARVKHLESERLDYKGWTYQPVSATWIDYGRWIAEQQRDQYEEHGHYSQ